MATIFLSNPKVFLRSLPSSSSCCSSSSTTVRQIVCKSAMNDVVVVGRRSITSLSLTTAATAATAFLLSTLVGGSEKANAAILEADEDDELMEKIKKDRKKRIEKQGVIKSSANETALLQDLVFKLSKIGQAIEKNDLSAASSVIGSSKDTEWVQKVNSALNKLSSSEEEKTEVDAFNSSLASLISSVSQNDIEASKLAFVASATAFEKWSTISGLVGQLKGL